MRIAAIGPFKIERELGRGGMGEVYLARDTRLDRQVAIKALPPHVAQDPDRLARFQREAKVLASLNHPRIGAIYGLEEAGGHQYLILEYIDGETLASQLAKGPIPVDEAMSLAKLIAEALEVAHEKGIIHRDLKPGNVMVTDEGAVKVLDFGLARTSDASPSSTGAVALGDTASVTSPARFANSPTIPGAIMGTAGYMSPEQARGKPVDKRSDIFSFGCVLYEMLTGSMPFRGETIADSIGATLHKESDLSLLPAATPRRVRDLLTNCLAKDRKNRLHDIGDARLELTRAMTEPREAGGSAAAAPEPWWRSAGALATLSLVALTVLTSAILLRPSRDGTRGVQRVLHASLALPKGTTFVEGARAVAVSPDGTQVVLSLAPKDGLTPPSLFMRDLSRPEFRPLSGTEGASFPCWSPDGKAIAFFAGGKLKRLDLAEGIVRVLCAAPVPRGASWGTKGTIVFAPSAGGGLMIVSDTGGTPTLATASTTPGESHRLPQMLPDGERFLYFVQNTPADGVYAYDPATKQSRLLMRGWTEAIFVEPGLLVFGRDENLLAQPFDVQRLELTGTARPVAADLYYDKTRAYMNAGLSPEGTLMYQQVRPQPRFKLAWMDREGERTTLPVEPLAISWSGARLSKDGRRAAVSLMGNRFENSLSVIDLERGIRTPLGDPSVTFVWGNLWGPGDQSVIGSEVRADQQCLASLPVNGGPGLRIWKGESGFENDPGSLTPDGKTILFTRAPVADKLPDLMTVPFGEDQTPKRFMQTPEGEWSPRLAPLGDIVAYLVASEEDWSGPVKLVTFPTPAAPVQVSTIPALFHSHIWIGPDELAWVDPSRKVWSATITAKDGQIDVGPPKPMFGGTPLDKQTRVLDYDIQRERFLIAIEHEPREDPRLIIVTDWRQDAAGSAPGQR
jgi:eukaryotic-like serine/threonine-protein kinase